MTVITMSRKELTRLQVVIDFADGRISADVAVELTHVSIAQLQAIHTQTHPGAKIVLDKVALTELLLGATPS